MEQLVTIYYLLLNLLLSKLAFVTTVIDDAAIAISANTGCNSPATAIGIAITLYPNAQNRFCFIFCNFDNSNF